MDSESERRTLLSLVRTDFISQKFRIQCFSPGRLVESNTSASGCLVPEGVGGRLPELRQVRSVSWILKRNENIQLQRQVSEFCQHMLPLTVVMMITRDLQNLTHRIVSNKL